MKRVGKAVGSGAIIFVLVFSITWALGSFTSASAASILHEIQRRGTLRVGWAVWWPYVYRDSKTNQLVGITVDMAEQMAKELNVKLEFVEDSWGTFAAGIQAKKFDVWNLVAITLPRATASGFSEPVTVHGLSLIVE